MLTSFQTASVMLLQQGEDMARRRFQQPHPFRDGKWWKIRWYEDVRDDNGEIRRVHRKSVIAIAVGPGSVTEKQAARLAWENILSKVDQYARCPQSIMTLRQFCAQRFEPEHVWALKHAGQQHYKYCLSKILPDLGDKQLRQVDAAAIQSLLRRTITAGKSVQTAHHLRTALHAIFEHARRCGHWSGDNPAGMTKLPEMVRRAVGALTVEQARGALSLLQSPEREMAFLSMTTSMNVAELCGLRWGRVNLSDEPIIADGTILHGRCAMVVENYYRNRPGTVKAGARNRIVPIPAEAIEMLSQLRSESKFTQRCDYVFACRTGRPIDAHNTNSRKLKPVGKAIGVKLSWHVFRHSCATFAESVEMARSDRIALMGHAGGKMTDKYTHSDLERRRASVEKIARAIRPAGFVPDRDPGDEQGKWIQ